MLLVPVPTVGVLFAMVFFPQTFAGKLLFALCKVWLVALPLLWYRFVEKGEIGLSGLRRNGLWAGVLSGVGISVAILLAYITLGGSLLDKTVITENLRKVGLAEPRIYLAGAVYWVLVNSIIEEYVWRWFALRQCRVLVGSVAAVLLSSLFFTLHHFFALNVYMDILPAFLGSLGIFAGGVIWALLYLRYRSLLPGWVSHLIVDVCVFAIGAHLLFCP